MCERQRLVISICLQRQTKTLACLAESQVRLITGSHCTLKNSCQLSHIRNLLCYNNRIASITVTQNLLCYNNRIASITVTQNLLCYNNRIASIIVTQHLLQTLPLRYYQLHIQEHKTYSTRNISALNLLLL